VPAVATSASPADLSASGTVVAESMIVAVATAVFRQRDAEDDSP
jgi:hypothetical protein